MLNILTENLSDMQIENFQEVFLSIIIPSVDFQAQLVSTKVKIN